MSNTYTPIQDETFEIVSRNVYGTEEYSAIIRQANPHVSSSTGTVPAGTTIFIPAVNPTRSTVDVDNEDEITLSVAGTRIKYFETLTIKDSVDGISQVSNTANCSGRSRTMLSSCLWVIRSDSAGLS
jgi:phage tail protein X